MYMGHFGIALGARRWLRPLPLVWLLFASIAPDLYDALAGLMPALDTGGISHTLPGAVGAAISFALATALICRNGALALGIGLLALSHTATDYLTSRMPVWPSGPSTGLHLYATPWADFLLESAVITIGLLLYARSPDLRRPARTGLIGMGALMIALQGVWNFVIAGR